MGDAPNQMNFYTLFTAILIDSGFFFSHSLKPGCQAVPLLIQWPEIKLQTLTDTYLLPCIILALFHIFLCLGQVRLLLACISPNSSTASYLSLFLSPSLPEASYPPSLPLLLNQGPSLTSHHFDSNSLYPECKVSSFKILKWLWPWLFELK